jgi:hypothetical protein
MKRIKAAIFAIGCLFASAMIAQADEPWCGNTTPSADCYPNSRANEHRLDAPQPSKGMLSRPLQLTGRVVDQAQIPSS